MNMFLLYYSAALAASEVNKLYYYISAAGPRHSGGDPARSGVLQDSRLHEGDQHAAGVLHRGQDVVRQLLSHGGGDGTAEPAGAR